MPTEVLRTHLALASRDQLKPGRTPDVQAAVRRLEHVSPAEYLALYTRIGGPWQWHDRLAWTEAELAVYLADDSVRVYVAEVGADLAGYFELKRIDDATIEIMYFGLDAAFI